MKEEDLVRRMRKDRFENLTDERLEEKRFLPPNVEDKNKNGDLLSYTEGKADLNGSEEEKMGYDAGDLPGNDYRNSRRTRSKRKSMN